MATSISTEAAAIALEPPPPSPPPPPSINRSRAIWRSRLGAALRTAVACSIVGCITLFGPKRLQNLVAFPALSYAVVILVVSEATLGDTVRGCWNALCATFQCIAPAFLVLWFLGPARYSISASVLAVTISAFLVALPESTHFICKRITMLMIVMTYAVSSIEGVHTGVFSHPMHVAASAAAGALSAVVALVLPYPRLACCEVKKKSMLLNTNMSQRLNFFVKAFCAENKTSALASISQAKSLVKPGSYLLQSIQTKQESMKWERPLNKLTRQYSMNPSERIQALETPLKGIEIALTSCASFPVRIADQEVKTLVLTQKEQISAKLKQTKFSALSDSSTVPETNGEEVHHNLSLQTLQTNFPSINDLPSFFFLFCMKLLHDESVATHSDRVAGKDNPTSKVEETPQQQKQSTKTFSFRSWPINVIGAARLVLAFKCSISLGLAVLFGMIYSKENGFWSGLTVAVGMSFGREATFKVANIKAQGTVLGSIYGVIACFIFQRFLAVRFLLLLPWIIFTSFLGRSRMYSQAGAASAVVAALIILGRKNYGPPSEFAITRVTEAFIGLACSISVELLLQPTRASTMAKIQLSQCLRKLQSYMGSMDLCADSKNKQAMCLKEARKNVGELGKFIAEAEVEPNFWFLPFNTACYGKLLGSMSKMVELFLFATQAIGFLIEESDRLQEHIGGDLDHFKKMVGSSLKCFEELTLIKSLATLESELQKRNISYDLELGKPSTNAYGFRILSADNEDEMKNITNSFLQHSREVVDAFDGDVELKRQMVLSLGALGFCIDGLMKETKEIEKCVKELVQWENPSSHVNLCEIFAKINALYT